MRFSLSFPILAATLLLLGFTLRLGAQYGTPPDASNQQYPGNQGYPASPYPQGQQQYPAGPPYQQGQEQGQGYPQSQGSSQGQYGTDQHDPADRQHGVARLSIVQGDVNVKRGDSGELLAAAVNAPLVARDRVQTALGSRAEIELDYGNAVRLAPDTDLGFADLTYHRYQVQLGAGTVIYRVLRNSEASVEIDTPSIGVRPSMPGEYRISVLEDGTTQVTVRSGNAEVIGPRGSQQLASGQTMQVRGNAADPQFETAYEIGRDQFDDWSAHRDRELQGSQSYRYVSRDVYGADDLDSYGDWVPSQYGTVWNPRPPSADWSPYSNGHWVWIDYYGWSWVDDAPWGWAPYHYGRWFRNGGRGWCWWPGEIDGGAYWSPALVGFFGFGGGIGWIPLAPYESCHRWWGGGFGFGVGFGFGRERGFDRFDRFRGNVAGSYRNAGVRGGAIIAGASQFGSRSGRFSAATRSQLAGASVLNGRLPVGPTSSSYRFANRQATVNPKFAAAGFGAAGNRSFFGHQQLGAGISQRMGQSGPGGSRFGTNPQYGSPNGHGVAPNMQNANPQRSIAARGGYQPAQPDSYRSRSEPAGGAGWQRFGQPGGAGNVRQSFAGNPEQSGWHSFGGSVQPRSLPGSGGNYGGGRSQSYRGPGQSTFSTPRPSYGGSSYAGSSRYSAPSTPRYSASSYSNHAYSSPAYSGQAYSNHDGGAPRSSEPHNSGGGRSGGSGQEGGGGHSSGGSGHHR